MSSYDKVVKLACKPKAAAPKAKYLDPIIAATWSTDGAVHDVCKALAPRFKEPNAVVVFKALIVLHTMIRNGATDNVLGHLCTNEVLRLSNVSSGNWEGYSPPENLQNYAAYLDSRIRAYADLKHDAIRVQAENNRDMRMEDDRARHEPKGISRSKTIAGRKLRVLTVEKGLLRETRAVHKMIDTLVECRFYLDDLEDELTTTALRMLVKDLLILFQAGNEGVINVLEHYFEMSHVDAEEALRIYRNFCKQTERVVEFLGVAKKLQNLLNVPIPNLKHAPVSLAGALQEYLDDPNFEQNRIEYRTNKEAVDRGHKNNVPSTSSKKDETTSTSPPPASTSTSPPPKNKTDAAMDFFQSIEETQPTMFNPQTLSPSTSYFQQQSTTNPFHQMQLMTGQPQIMGQPTGFIAPQHTIVPNPFGIPPQQQQNFLQPQPTGHRPFSSFLPTQPTGFQAPPLPTTRLLQPQQTGSNPFRQSMLLPHTMGTHSSGVDAFAGLSGASGFNGTVAQPPMPNLPPAFGGPSPMSPPLSIPARPASTPLTSLAPSVPRAASPPAAQPVKTHQTGTKNPFGPIVTAPPPVPKPPTLMELKMGTNGTMNGQPAHAQSNFTLSPVTSMPFSFENGALGVGATDISSVASTFAFSKNHSDTNKSNAPLPSLSPPSDQNKFDIPSFTNTPPSLNWQHTATTSNGSAFSDSIFSSMSSQTTGATTLSSSSTGSALKPHMTGLAGLKPFKPTSSFGASLLESLPPIPGSAPTTPAVTGVPSAGGTSDTAGSNPSALGGFSTSSSTLGVGLRPQMTGTSGASNPFRASMALPTGGPVYRGNSMALPTSGPAYRGNAPTGLPFGASGPSTATPQTSLGSSLFGASAFGSSAAGQQQQPKAAASFI